MIHILDTCICIDIIRNRSVDSIEWIKNLNICISYITLSELEYGINKSSNPEKNRIALQNFRSGLIVFPFDDAAAIVYGKIRTELESAGTPIGPLDTLIAAHAISLDAILITNNLKEFHRVKGLNVLSGIQN